MQDKLRKLNDAQIMLIIFLCVIFLCLLTICNGHNWGGDFSQYLAQTRAISENNISDWLDYYRKFYAGIFAADLSMDYSNNFRTDI